MQSVFLPLWNMSWVQTLHFARQNQRNGEHNYNHPDFGQFCCPKIIWSCLSAAARNARHSWGTVVQHVGLEISLFALHASLADITSLPPECLSGLQTLEFWPQLCFNHNYDYLLSIRQTLAVSSVPHMPPTLFRCIPSNCNFECKAEFNEWRDSAVRCYTATRKR